MSCTWNGNPMLERSDTIGARCADLIERGMRRMGLGRVPVACRPSEERAKLLQPYVPPLPAAKVAAILADWRGRPEQERRVEGVAREHGVSTNVVYRALRKAGLLRTQRDRQADVQALLADWRGLPERERRVAPLAAAHGISKSMAYRHLYDAGLIHSQPERTAEVQARIRAMWQGLPPHRRDRRLVAESLGVGLTTVYSVLPVDHKAEARAA